MKTLNKLITFLTLVLMLASCQKEKYYLDSGTHDPHFDGTVMQYLESKPEYFDTLVQVIKLAGMQEVFEKQEITFFAPSDSSFTKSFDLLNQILLTEGRDSIKKLSQINATVWKTELSLYLFKGKMLLNDFPQLDLNAIPVFSGQAYESYGGRPMNIGVIYHNAGGVQYAGYRQLVISYIPSLTSPREGWFNSWVASSNVQPANGVVHVLRFGDHFFGFNPIDFVQRAMDAGISNP